MIDLLTIRLYMGMYLDRYLCSVYEGKENTEEEGACILYFFTEYASFSTPVRSYRETIHLFLVAIEQISITNCKMQSRSS